jgi:hypothetical protein
MGEGMRFFSGPGYAEFFYELAEKEGRQGEALATLVRGKGYVRFESNRGAVLPVGGWEDWVDLGFGK